MKFKLPNKNLKGFTLVEIMVVISIIAILGGITISGDYKANKIRNGLLVDTESIATDIRDMQNRTTSFVQNPNINNIGYGIYFDLSENASLKTETFYKQTEDVFDKSELSTSNNMRPIDNYIFNQGNYIKRICINGCSTHEINPLGKLAVYYIKPKPYTNFAFTDDGLTYYTEYAGNSISHACIEVASHLGQDIRRVDIYYIGQISFSLGTCSD